MSKSKLYKLNTELNLAEIKFKQLCLNHVDLKGFEFHLSKELEQKIIQENTVESGEHLGVKSKLNIIKYKNQLISDIIQFDL